MWLKTKSKHQRDAGFAQISRQQPQVVDRAEPRIDGAVVADRISAVVVAGPDGEQRHQVQVGQAEFLEVADVLPQPAQVLAEQVDVQRTADDLLRLKPIRFVDAMLIQLAELVGAIGPGLRRGREHLLDVVEEVVSRSVELIEQPEKRTPVFVQPQLRTRAAWQSSTWLVCQTSSSRG